MRLKKLPKFEETEAVSRHFSQISLEMSSGDSMFSFVLPCYKTLVTLRGDFPALFPSLTPQSELEDNTYSCWLPNFERFLYYSLCRIVADDPKSTISLVLPWVIKLVTLRCELKTRPGLALGPPGAP